MPPCPDLKASSALALCITSLAVVMGGSVYRDEDRAQFLGLVGVVCERFNWVGYAYPVFAIRAIA